MTSLRLIRICHQQTCLFLYRRTSFSNCITTDAILDCLTYLDLWSIDRLCRSRCRFILHGNFVGIMAVAWCQTLSLMSRGSFTHRWNSRFYSMCCEFFAEPWEFKLNTQVCNLTKKQRCHGTKSYQSKEEHMVMLLARFGFSNLVIISMTYRGPPFYNRLDLSISSSGWFSINCFFLGSKLTLWHNSVGPDSANQKLSRSEVHIW